MSIYRTRRGFAYGVIRDGSTTVIVLRPPQDTTPKAAA